MRGTFAIFLLVATGAMVSARGGPGPAGFTDVHGQRAPGFAVNDASGHSGDAAWRGRGPCDADWGALGPFGGDAEDVAVSPVDPAIVLAGLAPNGSSGGTLFRSVDGGASWTEVAALSGTSVFSIAFTSTGAVYIGTEDGVWKSTDGGATWAQLDLNIGLNDTVKVVSIDPANESVVYAGVDSALGNQDKNVLKSTDGGATWSDITPAMSAMTCNGLAINPGDSDNLVAAFSGSFGGGAVWISDDGGATWTDRSAGLPGNPINDAVHDGGRILVCGGMAYGSQAVGLYESTDNGQTWSALHDGSWPTLYANDVEVDPADPSHVFVAIRGGLCRSLDGGATWEVGVGDTLALMLNSVRLDPGDATGIFIGASSAAVWRSTDGGDTFVQSSVGIGQLNVYSVAVNPNNIAELAIAFQGLNDGGVYTSVDGGVSWTLEGGLPPTRYNTVGFAPDGTLYAISDGPTTVGTEGLYRRNSDGTWTSLGPDQGTYFESELFSMCFSRHNAGLILLGGSDFGVVGHEATVWRSTDAGVNWTKVYEGTADFEEVYGIEIVEDGTDTVMIASYLDTGSDHSGGALRSTDGGASWSDSSTGLVYGVQGYALCASPDDPNTFYYADGASGGGVFVSTDAGQSWTNTGYSGQSVRDVVVDPRDAQTIYIIQWADPKVLVSTDAGATFSEFNAGLGSFGTARDLDFAAGYQPRLVLASSTGTYATDLCRCPQAGCEADLTGDCIVGLDDLAILLANYGQPGSIAEGDIAPPHDGTVGLDDLALLLAQYGNDCN